jgi:hypothetical protein
MIVNTELEGMWKEAFVTEYDVLFEDVSGGTENTSYSGRCLKPGPPEYEAGKLPVRSVFSVK